MTKAIDISIVVPLLNEEESLQELTLWIARVMNQNSFSYEVLMIDDGSTDRSWEIIQTLNSDNSAIKGIRFNRNYGKSAALHVGFKNAVGDVVITMDADMQDSPDEIPALYDMIMNEGYDLVSGWKKKRYDPISKTIPTKLFNFVTQRVSGIRLNDFNCGLKAYKNRVVKSIEVYGEMHRYIPVIAKWAGFKKIGEKVVVHQARKYGTTKFGGFNRFINGFLDLLSITFVSKFKKKPMHFFGSLGSLSFIFGFFMTIYLIVEKFRHVGKPGYREIVDQPIFYLALVALLIGVQLFLAGYIAEMISINAPNRNDYLVAEKVE